MNDNPQLPGPSSTLDTSVIEAVFDGKRKPYQQAMINAFQSLSWLDEYLQENEDTPRPLVEAGMQLILEKGMKILQGTPDATVPTDEEPATA